MDSQDRDKSRFERRREPLARRIGEALDEMGSRNTGDCPDAEILAAYAERGLGLEETAKWESHFATCSRCRKILLVLDASAETPLAEKEVARLAELAAATPAGAERARAASGGTWPWLADWRLRWLAPAIGVAAVLAVMFVLRTPRRARDQAPTETLVAQVPKQESPLSPVPSELDRISGAVPARPQMQQAVPRANEEVASTEADK
jgi:anti-sigma-K factor RskA